MSEIASPSIFGSATYSKSGSSIPSLPSDGFRGGLPLRVLVVDDEPDTLDLLRRVLGDSKAQVAAAPSVEAALAALGDFAPHVLISDVSMPGRDGYELIRAIRATTGPDALPAAALTAYSGPEDAARAKEAGFQMHIPKPVEPEQLVKVVAQLAGREAALVAETT